MLKYKGKYRLCCEFNQNTLEPQKDDVYIQCSKNGQIYRALNDKLAYYRPSRGNSETLSKELIELGVIGVRNCSTDGDMLIYFDESCLDVVANKVGAKTSGANINPWSIRNLRKMDWFKKREKEYEELGLIKPKVELSEEEKEVYRQRFNNNIPK